jgi:hypothetical protein
MEIRFAEVQWYCKLYNLENESVAVAMVKMFSRWDPDIARKTTLAHRSVAWSDDLVVIDVHHIVSVCSMYPDDSRPGRYQAARKPGHLASVLIGEQDPVEE